MKPADRDRLRKLQDKFLALPWVRRHVEENGEERLLFGYYATDGPTFRELRTMVCPAVESYLHMLLEESGQ